jgi:5-methyltetrahydropteroyltriglutamate--homocysteine methyltransferase
MIDDYLADVVAILREEVDELARQGCTYIQVDAPQYAGLVDPEIREGYRRRGNDPDHLLQRCIDLDNAVISGHAEMTFGLHLCRGNYRSRFYASGGYNPVTDVFRRTRFQRFLLEYDDERSGDFEPLGQVPDDRVVVLGLVSTKKGALETKDALKGRIDEAARHIPLDRLALSTQCGFASTEEGNAVTPDEQAAKLRLVAETARDVWG